MTPLVVEAELEVSEAVDRHLFGNGTNDGANLILQRYVLVAGALRYEVRTLQVQCPKLVDHDRLVRVLERLGKRTNGHSHGAANRAADTYVDVGDPPHGTDHVRFRNVVTGVYDHNQEGNTSSRLSGSWVAEHCGDRTEERLHDQRDGDNDKEEDATLEA